MHIRANTAGELWFETLRRLYADGQPVSPRGMLSRERRAVTLNLENVRNNVFYSQARNLSYRFMIAEWLWVWFGRDDVETIAYYNPNIAQFSDDGHTFNGTYGKPISQRWPDVVGLLKRDLTSRQAVIDIFGSMHSYESKDIACTLTIQFLVRRRGAQDVLETIVCMRSSDVWLGLPYDVFTFTMLANVLAAELHVEPGPLTLHLGSSHLYEGDFEKARLVLEHPLLDPLTSPRLNERPPQELDVVLSTRERATSLSNPWAAYANILTATTNAAALTFIRELAGPLS